MLRVVLDPSGRRCLPVSYMQIDTESSLLSRQAHVRNRIYSQVILAM